MTSIGEFLHRIPGLVIASIRGCFPAVPTQHVGGDAIYLISACHDRSIQKLPGQGENEFLHWDMNPFASFTKNTPSCTSALAASASLVAKSSAACAAGLQGAAPIPSSATSSLASTLPSTGLCGKVCYTISRFVAVLGSHTEEFHREFVSKYGKLYPNTSLSAVKFGLDANKQDPMELQKRRHEFHVPAGCVMFW